ncbi:MAG: cofactor-independent phosphoglycerate mutase [Anaerolineae bacterium]|nr:cofactor-independent phosphoglycerate mutase [Anaerolineae bacterium]
MKAIIILGDGMSDYPVEHLGGKTPLQAANKPSLDRIAREGRMGLFETIPDGLSKGSAVANLSVLGYDPATTYNGRAVLEAANMGVALDDDDVAFRLNLCCIENGLIKNHSAGHITTEEAGEIIRSLHMALGEASGEMPVDLHSGVSYRHLLVLRGAAASPKVKCAPPHDHVGERAEDLLPTAASDEAKATETRVRSLMTRAEGILKDHPVNLKRIAEGKDPANAIWPWSPGHKPKMATFQERFGVHGAVISAVDLIMGLGLYAGMDVVRVEGATGLWDTNYEGKAAACLKAIQDHDLVYVHVEATDEAGHAKDVDLKIKCIEMLDDRLVRPILEGVEKLGLDVVMAVLPDHPTPVSTGVHVRDPVPVAIMRPGDTPDDATCFDEEQARDGSIPFMRRDDFIKLVLGVTEKHGAGG